MASFSSFAKSSVRRLAWRLAGIRNTRLWPHLRPLVHMLRRPLRLDHVLGLESAAPREGFLHASTVPEPFRGATDVHAFARRLRLGFHERGLQELENIAFQPRRPERRESALWELALWHLNQPGKPAAEAALRYLDVLESLPGTKSPRALRHVMYVEALLRAERWQEACAKALAFADKRPSDPNVLLTCANVFARATKENVPHADAAALQLQWINRAMQKTGLEPLTLRDPAAGVNIDNLAVRLPENAGIPSGPLVTVIVPVFNAAERIRTALDALCAQTWRNLEILVVDDCSTDNTCTLVEEYSEKDARVRLIRAPENRGPYVARNIGLAEAQGEFVTTHDDDDWSHPRKIQCQVQHLQSTPSAIANLSGHVRADDDLYFALRGNPGWFLFPNMSSLMFRREPVMKKVGFWDCVRFAGDSEFKKRLECIFGEDRVVSLPTGPMAILRVRESSLTASRITGYHGYKVGARREYDEAFKAWHARAAKGEPVRMPFPVERRPFPAPYIMSHAEGSEEQVFDLILMSEFRLPGGTTVSNVQEISAARDMGLRIGLVQAPSFHMRPSRKIQSRIRDLVDGKQVRLLNWGEKAYADLVVVRFPLVLNSDNECLPEIRTRDVRIIANQPPQRTWDADSELLYDVAECDRRAREWFGVTPVWHPIGPTAREGMLAMGADINMADWDWVNIIDFSEWSAPRTPLQGKRIVIGRHSRDHWVKWPENATDLLAAYPDDSRFDVRVLGGALSAREVIGRIPRNWTVHEFGSMPPKDFLAQLDFFVYFTHSRYLEAFGRSIFEAMAAGVPVILAPQFRKAFGEAALYAEPGEVAGLVQELAADPQRYEERVEIGRRFVQERFGYEQHHARLRRLLVSPKEPHAELVAG